MITTTSSWNAKNASPAKLPIYAFAIAGQPTVYTTGDLARWGVTGYPSYEPWLLTPQGASQTIDVINGSSSIGNLECEVVDHGGAIRQLVGQNTLEGSTVTLSVGYPGLAWTDFALLHTYMLREIEPSDGYNSFLFTCEDAQLLEKRTVYTHPLNGYGLSAENPWYVSGTPAQIYQAMVLLALGLPAANIDRTVLAALDSAAENIFAPLRPFRFTITASFEVKQWLEQELFKPSGVYQVALPSGALSLRSMRAPAAGPVPVYTFTEHNLTALPKCGRLPIVNQAIWDFDYDGSGYLNTDTFLQATSISQYSQGQQFSVSSQGLRTELGAFPWAEWVSSRLFRRFSGVAPGIKGGAPVLTIEAMLMTLPVWVGDYVALTHSKMPDMTTGNLGVTARIYEVIERQPSYSEGKMRYKLLDSGLTGQPAAYQFGAAPTRPFLIGTSLLY
jgi:hypothetical protein